MNHSPQPNRCKNPNCKRILSDRGKPNKSGFCSNCFRLDPENRKKHLEQQKKWRERKKLDKNQTERIKTIKNN